MPLFFITTVVRTILACQERQWVGKILSLTNPSAHVELPCDGREMLGVGPYKLPRLWLGLGVEDEFSVFNLQQVDALHRIAAAPVVAD